MKLQNQSAISQKLKHAGLDWNKLLFNDAVVLSFRPLFYASEDFKGLHYLDWR